MELQLKAPTLTPVLSELNMTESELEPIRIMVQKYLAENYATQEEEEEDGSIKWIPISNPHNQKV